MEKEMSKSKTPKVDRYRKMLDRVFNRLIKFSNMDNVMLGNNDHLVAYDGRWYNEEFKKFNKIKKEN